MTSQPTPTADPIPAEDTNWWRSAVVYQIYPRSFADHNGDGTGDVRGMIDRLPHLAELGVDAIWVSPWYPSPLADGGYDVADYRDIHPDFGTLEDADAFIARAHELGLRVLIDLVPNHCSDEHPWFQAALAAGPGTPERELFWFRDGRGVDGELPPNDWQAMFGGPAWERVIGPDGRGEQWYLHLFDVRQPDWNWAQPAVADEFDDILRFWFDRGIDGFRIDVADSMAKDPDLPDVAHGTSNLTKSVGSPLWDRPELDVIHRRWRAVADEYADSPQGARVFVSEAVLPAARVAHYVTPERLHTTFNFDALLCEWTAQSQRHMIQLSLQVHDAVGAPCTWVLSNHDRVRVATRYGKPITGVAYGPEGGSREFTPLEEEEIRAMPTDVALGLKRARAAALLELALPGGAYVYQGDELGLDEVDDLPEESLQDPTWERSGHTVHGRDGCRVPIPWSGTTSPFGFGPGGEPWLPMPARWAGQTVADQEHDPTSHLALYRAALAERKRNPALGDGTLSWVASDAHVLDFTREPGFRCIVNFGPDAVPIPADARVLIHSGDPNSGRVETDEAVWLAI
ncbi:MAG: glycoside hydrolase family 13 protein [Propionibacteriaceae bacterium]|nr:glycoside hydrolase family 13 protein [Propionibacteriaceae bacterium]